MASNTNPVKTHTAHSQQTPLGRFVDILYKKFVTNTMTNRTDGA